MIADLMALSLGAACPEVTDFGPLAFRLPNPRSTPNRSLRSRCSVAWAGTRWSVANTGPPFSDWSRLARATNNLAISSGVRASVYTARAVGNFLRRRSCVVGSTVMTTPEARATAWNRVADRGTSLTNKSRRNAGSRLSSAAILLRTSSRSSSGIVVKSGNRASIDSNGIGVPSGGEPTTLPPPDCRGDGAVSGTAPLGGGKTANCGSPAPLIPGSDSLGYGLSSGPRSAIDSDGSVWRSTGLRSLGSRSRCTILLWPSSDSSRRETQNDALVTASSSEAATMYGSHPTRADAVRAGTFAMAAVGRGKSTTRALTIPARSEGAGWRGRPRIRRLSCLRCVNRAAAAGSRARRL